MSKSIRRVGGVIWRGWLYTSWAGRRYVALRSAIPGATAMATGGATFVQALGAWLLCGRGLIVDEGDGAMLPADATGAVPVDVIDVDRLSWREAEVVIRGLGLCVSRTGYGRERVIRYRRGSMGETLCLLSGGDRRGSGYYTDDPVDAVWAAVSLVRWAMERCQRCGAAVTVGESCGC